VEASPTSGPGSPNYPFTRGLAEGDPYKLYLVTNPAVRKSLNLKPFGVKVKPIDFCADRFVFRDDEYEIPTLLAFVRLAHSMSSDDRKRVMPRWMLVDLTLMPSAMLLALSGQDHVTKVARDLERGRYTLSYSDGRSHAAALRDLLAVAHERGYQGPLPVAGYAAIPTLQPGCWVGGSLWWSLVPGIRLGYSVRRIALVCYRAEREIGVTQFTNTGALLAQKDFGRLRVTHTNLAVHPRPGTFVYEVDLTALPSDGGPAPVIEAPAKPVSLNPADSGLAQDLLAIQRQLDEGSNCYVGPAQQAGPWPVIYTEPPARTKAQPPDPLRGGDIGGHAGSHAESDSEQGFLTPSIGKGPYKPYIICNASMLNRLNRTPLGIELGHIDFCKETFGEGHQVQALVDLLSRAIALGYAESGLGAPKWAMVELALMPSAVLLIMADQDHLAAVADELAKEPVIEERRTRLIPLTEDDSNRLRNANSLRNLLDAAAQQGYQGPLPIAGYAAAPTPQATRWVGWSLWSLIPGQRLGYTAKRLGLACYGVKRQTAVIQFHMARGIDVVAKFGMLRLTTVDVRPHPAPNAFAYEIDVSKLPSDGSPITPSKRKKAQWQLDPDSDQLARDLERMRRGVERGTRYFLLARPSGKARSPMIPVHQRTLPHRWAWARAKLLVSNAKARRAARRRARYGR
jgi:hypothetical protein